jgi:hypothetical protein
MAKDSAKNELDALLPRIPTLRVVSAPSSSAPRALSIDDASIPLDRLDQPLPIDPGNHAVRLERSDGFADARTVTVHEAETARVELGADRRNSEPARGVYVPGVIALGGAVVALGVGAVAGGVALNKTNDLKSRCNGGHCPESDSGQRDDIDVLGAASTVGFIAGAVLVGAGIVLLVTHPGDAKRSSAHGLVPLSARF